MSGAIKTVISGIRYSLVLLGLHFFPVSGQWKGEIDSANDVLLKNRYVEIEATQAMFDMYNMNFDRAERGFNYLKKLYGWHPLPDFLLGLNTWWRLMPYGEQETEWDDQFLAYMDSSEMLAQRLYEEVNQLEGAFFLAATYAFQGRYHADRGDYMKASFAGKNALKYLEISRGNEDFSPELLFGDGIFNYYAEWIPEHYKMLKPIMAFFPDGDKALGLQQLEETARNAFYSRTEAQYYLMRILYVEERKMGEAFQIAEYLHNSYPNNSYFHRFYAQLLYQMGRYNEAISSSEEILDRVSECWSGYENNSARYAAFFLGHSYELAGKNELASLYFKQSIFYAEQANATDKGYYYFSHLHLGNIAEVEEDYELAIEYYQTVKKLTDRKHSANQRARARLKDLKKL